MFQRLIDLISKTDPETADGVVMYVLCFVAGFIVAMLAFGH